MAFSHDNEDDDPHFPHSDPWSPCVYKSSRGTVHSEAHSLLALTHWSQLLHLASNVIPPVAHRGLFLHALLGFSYEILGVRALSRMTSGEATKSFWGRRYWCHFFSLFFFETIAERGFGGNLVGLMIPLHQQPPTQTVSSWLCMAVSKPETKITANKNLLTARFHDTFPVVWSSLLSTLPPRDHSTGRDHFPLPAPGKGPRECTCSSQGSSERLNVAAKQ